MAYVSVVLRSIVVVMGKVRLEANIWASHVL